MSEICKICNNDANPFIGKCPHGGERMSEKSVLGQEMCPHCLKVHAEILRIGLRRHQGIVRRLLKAVEYFHSGDDMSFKIHKRTQRTCQDCLLISETHSLLGGR